MTAEGPVRGGLFEGKEVQVIGTVVPGSASGDLGKLRGNGAYFRVVHPRPAV